MHLINIENLNFKLFAGFTCDE